MPGFRRWFSLTVWAYVVGMIAYVTLKAAFIPFTYDEAFSFTHFSTLPVWDVMRSPQAFRVANNHVLNTLGMKLISLFGRQPILLRLPNLLAYGLFLYSTCRIAKLFFSHPLLRLALLLALSLNPMLSEFFAVARGYGLGIGFLLFSVLQAMLVVDGHEGRSTIISTHLCLAAGVLAAYSSFSFLLPVAVIFVVLAGQSILILFRKKSPERSNVTLIKQNGRGIALPLIYSAILYWLIQKPISWLIAAKALYRGGGADFFSDTWSSIINDLLGYRSPDFEVMENGGPAPDNLIIVAIVSLALLISSFIVAAIIFSRRKSLQPQMPAIFACLLLAGCITGINVLFYMQGTPFITFRVALYVYPLIVLSIFSGIKAVELVHAKAAQITGALLAGLLLVNFIAQLNISTTRDWRFDAFTDKVCHYIVGDKKSLPARLATYHLMQPALEFYTTTQYKGRITVQYFNDSVFQCCPAAYDYIYYPRIRAGKLWQHYRVVQTYDDSTYLLFRRK